MAQELPSQSGKLNKGWKLKKKKKKAGETINRDRRVKNSSPGKCSANSNLRRHH